jgi:mannose-6-phosphate isomerase
VVDSPEPGQTLGQLVRERGPELLGRHAGLGRFPLLLKFLDASDRLSVQVHPDDEQAAAWHPGEPGKTEAWVILAAEPGACVYAGLEPGITRDALEAALRNGTVESCLHRVPVVAGDCLFIPAGTVHAIGEGILLAEVQQSSDLTYRLFDWNRIGADGKPRALHIEDSLGCTDFARGPVSPVRPKVLAYGAGHRIEELVRCPYFVLRRHTLREPAHLELDERCHILMGLAGAVRLVCAGGNASLARGRTLLVPASAGDVSLEPEGEATFLEIFWD